MARLDVREDLRQGREPFGKIMAAVAALAPDEDFELIAPFEPYPLYAVLEQRGFDHEAEQGKDGSWRVRFHRA
jgi:uncharacterized protein (DUF2249 family)